MLARPAFGVNLMAFSEVVVSDLLGRRVGESSITSPTAAGSISVSDAGACFAAREGAAQ